ncbi:hypothetical protein L596_000584 [Steinernema carpocapsae]|uniref:Uncharacterized protein n=1 Tax=Steinernema carpocapsae TaxID=34508 RepID=A0A4V6I760_STECR|nr:hypothetical protein L596_000584 [Steinernema carpocapsae]
MAMFSVLSRTSHQEKNNHLIQPSSYNYIIYERILQKRALPRLYERRFTMAIESYFLFRLGHSYRSVFPFSNKTSLFILKDAARTVCNAAILQQSCSTRIIFLKCLRYQVI